jgi:CheY-like chemotaxis protein
MREILMFDDHIIAKTLLMDVVEGQNIKVHYCHTVNEASDKWEESGGQIDMIILDLMMSSYGLPIEWREQTEDDYLTGWVWLNMINNTQKSISKKRIVVYSAYLSFLKYHMDKSDISDQEKALYASTIRLGKGSIPQAKLLRNLVIESDLKTSSKRGE